MRVIAGIAKGKKLKAPSGMNTRPVTDMIKEALFNVLGNRVEGSNFLDLFAGSGGVGIEALSRGAEMVLFIDRDGFAIRTIRENLLNCGFPSNSYEVYRNDVFKAVDILKKKDNKFDFIYIDPPFTEERLFSEIMTKLDTVNLLAKEGIIIIRARRKKDMPEKLAYLRRYRLDKYGESTLHYYNRDEEAGF